MPLLFCLALATVLVTAYVFVKSADEMAYLAATISIVSLILSLVVAPWQIQLLLLLVVLLITRRLSLPSGSLVQPPSEKKTQLTYRGSNYELTPPTEDVTESEVTGKYRGQICKFYPQKQAPQQQPISGLKYRGASVMVQQPPSPEVQAIADTAVARIEENRDSVVSAS